MGTEHGNGDAGVGEAASILRLIETAGNLSATVLLIIAIWYLFSGRIPTPREYQTAIERIEQERTRAERVEQQAEDAHRRLRILTETLPEITELMDSMDKRLDTEGYPAREHRRLRWPWERG
jgi:hypothetical protein